MSRMAAGQVVSEAQCFGGGDGDGEHPESTPPPRGAKRWQQRAGVEATGRRWWWYGTRLQRQAARKGEQAVASTQTKEWAGRAIEAGALHSSRSRHSGGEGCKLREAGRHTAREAGARHSSRSRQGDGEWAAQIGAGRQAAREAARRPLHCTARRVGEQTSRDVGVLYDPRSMWRFGQAEGCCTSRARRVAAGNVGECAAQLEEQAGRWRGRLVGGRCTIQLGE